MLKRGYSRTVSIRLLAAGGTQGILFPPGIALIMYVNPTGAIIMLAGLYYGATYGGSTTSILVNIPGEAGSVGTYFDGFPMTKRGRAKEALWISAVGPFIAGTQRQALQEWLSGV